MRRVRPGIAPREQRDQKLFLETVLVGTSLGVELFNSIIMKPVTKSISVFGTALLGLLAITTSRAALDLPDASHQTARRLDRHHRHLSPASRGRAKDLGRSRPPR